MSPSISMTLRYMPRNDGENSSSGRTAASRPSPARPSPSSARAGLAPPTAISRPKTQAAAGTPRPSTTGNWSLRVMAPLPVLSRADRAPRALTATSLSLSVLSAIAARVGGRACSGRAACVRSGRAASSGTSGGRSENAAAQIAERRHAVQGNAAATVRGERRALAMKTRWHGAHLTEGDQACQCDGRGRRWPAGRALRAERLANLHLDLLQGVEDERVGPGEGRRHDVAALQHFFERRLKRRHRRAGGLGADRFEKRRCQLLRLAGVFLPRRRRSPRAARAGAAPSPRARSPSPVRYARRPRPARRQDVAATPASSRRRTPRRCTG